MVKAEIHNGDGSLTVTVPMTFKKRGGRKLVISPSGADAWAPPRARADNAMVKALARAHRWQKMLDAGRYQTVRDLAEAENINPSYVARVLRLTLLAPDIVEAILDGRHDPERVTLDRLMEPFSGVWSMQSWFPGKQRGHNTRASRLPKVGLFRCTARAVSGRGASLDDDPLFRRFQAYRSNL